MATLVTTIRESIRYKGKEGQLAWIGHRVAGLGTLLFFMIHVVDTSWVYLWPQGYNHALAIYQSGNVRGISGGERCRLSIL